jgi:hypothetical protein
LDRRTFEPSDVMPSLSTIDQGHARWHATIGDGRAPRRRPSIIVLRLVHRHGTIFQP